MPTDSVRDASLGLQNVGRAVDPEDYASPIARWFGDRFPSEPVARVDNFAFPSEGFSNETLLFDVTTTDGADERVRRYAARIQATGLPLAAQQTPRCPVEIEFEYRLQRAVAQSGAGPVAPLVGFEPNTEYLGRPFFVMRYVPGRVPGVSPSFHTSGFMKEEATPDQRKHLVETTLGAMAAIGEQDWRKSELVGLFDAARGEPDLQYQLEIYRRDFDKQLAGRPFGLMSRALDWLFSNAPERQAIGFVWGDARVGNVIYNDDYEPVALLDWENGFVGPVEADIGWLLANDRLGHEVQEIPRLEGYPEHEEIIALYEAVSKREVRDVIYWEVFAAMRMAHGMLRLSDRMAETRAAAEQATGLGFENPVTDLLTRLLSRV